MILRRLGNFHYAVTQAEHARQSAAILACFKDELLGPPEERLALLMATRHHDDGWKHWDREPKLAEDGLPLNFHSIPAEDHFEIWRRTIYGTLAKRGPVEAAIIARHGGDFLKARGGWIAEWVPETIAALDARVAALGAGAPSPVALDRAFQVLRFADILSLVACADWSSEREETLLDSKGERHFFRFRRDDPWTVRVAPWPFAYDAVDLAHLDGVAIPAGEEARAADLLARPREWAVRLPVRYRKG